MTLAEWMAIQTPKMTDEAFGRLIGVGRPMVNKLRRRLAAPGPATAIAILKVTGGNCQLPDLMPLPAPEKEMA